MKKWLLVLSVLLLLLCFVSCWDGTTERTFHYSNGTYQVAEYDKNGLQTKGTFYKEDGTLDYTEIRTYHENGVLASIMRLRGEWFVHRYKYDENGNLASKELTYESGIPWLSETYVDGVLRQQTWYAEYGERYIRREYDGDGRLVKLAQYIEDRCLGMRAEFTYDKDGRIATQRYFDGAETMFRTVTIEYGETGARTRETHCSAGGTVEKVIDYIGRADEAAQEMLKEAYLNLYIRPQRADATVDEVYIRKYLGEYHGVYAAMIDPTGMAVSMGEKSETVDGVTFYYSDGQTIKVYDGTEFCSLQEAFERGLLTHEDLVAIEERHGGKSLNERLLELIAKITIGETYYNVVIKPEFAGATEDEVVICQYYGTFGDVHTAMVTTPYFDYTEAHWNEKIDGITIHYTNGNRALAFCDGAVYTLTEAFDRGLLTHENIQAIADIQNKNFQ